MIAPAEYSTVNRLNHRRTGEPKLFRTPEESVERGMEPEGLVHQSIASHPVVSLAAACTIGLAIGWVVKRQLGQS